MASPISRPKSKLPVLKESIFTTMSGLAHKHKAINLSQGFPNFEPDPKLLDLVNKAMRDGYNQYAPLGGIYSLREIIAEKINSLYGAHYDPETEITITVGATQAIYTAISALVWPTDEVLVLKPAYDCYEPAILSNGGTPVYLQLKPKTFEVDWKEFRNKISSRTRMVIINTPHNPSGKVWSKSEMLKLQACLKDTDIVLLSDEVYEHIVFDSHEHASASKFSDLASRSIVCASFGKTFHVTGWKMGYCAAPAVLMQEIRKIHEFNVFCTNHPIQKALATYLKEPAHYLNLGPFFQGKRDFFLADLSQTAFKFTPAEGTYFQLLDYSEISTEKDVDFAKRLAIDYGLASIPTSVFNVDGEDHKQLRFCFAKKEETLVRAIEILKKF